MSKKAKLVYGWGVNDADYAVQPRVGGKTQWCPYYKVWMHMVERSFSERLIRKYPNYEGCTIFEEWKYFSNFITWVDSQPNKNWKSCALDKDLLILGNKVYSPETCVFIPQQLNNFTTTRAASRGQYMLGVIFHKRDQMFVASCRNPFNKKQESLGYYSTELEAHKVWQAKKHEHAHSLAELQSDPRIAKALRERYSPDKDWTKA